MLSLRDEEDVEVALVAELADLDDASREALAEALLEAGFVLEVVEVLEIEEDVGKAPPGTPTKGYTVC